MKPLPGYEGAVLTEEQVDDILNQFVLAVIMAQFLVAIDKLRRGARIVE